MNRREIVWVLPVLFFCSMAWAGSPRYATCGTDEKMTIDERIADCSEKNASNLVDANMKLVMADAKGHEIKEDGFGVLWGDRLVPEGRNQRGNFTFLEAAGDKKQWLRGACEQFANAGSGYPTIQGKDGKPLVWVQPEAKDFARNGRSDQEYFNDNRANASNEEDINGNATWKELSNWSDWYWSSSPFDSDSGWDFHGVFGYVYDGYGRDFGFSVRCVARR